ncbi:MAG: hypothetical protein H0V49_07100 [Nocardioidaceae bacterium]|nr:hypothetical protein [Nocardioidaceae bacterium]
MSSPQEQYAESLRTGQKAVSNAVESWTKSAQSALGTPPASTSGAFNPSTVIDQVFDFAERMLQVQRDFAKTLSATAASAAESAREQTEAAAESIREQTSAAKKQTSAPRKQTSTAKKQPSSAKQTSTAKTTSTAQKKARKA